MRQSLIPLSLALLLSSCSVVREPSPFDTFSGPEGTWVALFPLSISTPELLQRIAEDPLAAFPEAPPQSAALLLQNMGGCDSLLPALSVRIPEESSCKALREAMGTYADRPHPLFIAGIYPWGNTLPSSGTSVGCLPRGIPPREGQEEILKEAGENRNNLVRFAELCHALPGYPLATPDLIFQLPITYSGGGILFPSPETSPVAGLFHELSSLFCRTAQGVELFPLLVTNPPEPSSQVSPLPPLHTFVYAAHYEGEAILTALSAKRITFATPGAFLTFRTYQGNQYLGGSGERAMGIRNEKLFLRIRGNAPEAGTVKLYKAGAWSEFCSNILPAPPLSVWNVCGEGSCTFELVHAEENPSSGILWVTLEMETGGGFAYPLSLAIRP